MPNRRAALVSLLCLLLASLSACGDPDDTGRHRLRTRPLPDKAALYGDAGMMPTREGERARRELALAGEIQAAMAALPGFDAVHVNVSVPQEPSMPATIVISASFTGTDNIENSGYRAQDAEQESVEAELRTLATAIVPRASTRNVTLLLRRVPTRGLPASPPPLLPLALALLGLGVSLGIAGERLLRRARPFSGGMDHARGYSSRTK